jgi:hypothetical protein
MATPGVRRWRIQEVDRAGVGGATPAAFTSSPFARDGQVAITTGTLVTAVQQGATIGNGEAVATCDNRKQSVNVANVPGPFSQGTANAVAEVINADSTSFAFTSRGVMVH